MERMGVILLYLLVSLPEFYAYAALVGKTMKRVRFDVRQLLRDAPVRRTREKLLKLQLSTLVLARARA